MARAEIPVIAPLAPRQGDKATLLHHEGFRYAIYPRRGGQWPELGTSDDREWIGRFLGRIHLIGASRTFAHRPRLSAQALGRDSYEYLLSEERIPEYVAHRYERVAGELLDLVEDKFELVGPYRNIRIHGDCHRNNVLWTDAGPHFVDLDDCMTGPAVQDLWMLLAGNAEEMKAQLKDILEGYSQFADFDHEQVMLIEPLRALRMIHYTAWLARRWHDPAFPRAFPWFGEVRYWEHHVSELEEQLFTLERG